MKNLLLGIKIFTPIKKCSKNNSTKYRENIISLHAIMNLVIKMNLGNKISKYRRKLNLTQQELAEKLYVTDKTISSWESNRTEPSIETIKLLSEIFSCSVNELINNQDKKNDIETEIKIKLTEEEYQKLNTFFTENGKFLKEITQVDTYYQPVARKFLKGNNEEITEWLRIGLRGNKKILNYKNWYNNMYCDEYEVEIDDEINLAKILKIIGLEELTVVDKKRRVFLYLDKYEIVLDEVKNLGYFIEIEVKEYSNAAQEEYDALLRLAKELNLNLNNLDKRGYPYHLIYKDY